MKDAKLVLKQNHSHNTIVRVGEHVGFGGIEITVIAGPCAVENKAQIETSAKVLSAGGIQCLRGGVYKPRTSPYSFAGLGVDGLELLAEAGRQVQMPVVSEVMSAEQIPLMEPHIDILQVGSRNMQNFDLLRALGKTCRPVLLKRGLASTIEEFVLAAEYILSNGNPNVILCERGIRSFDTYTRNVLDLGAVVALKQLTHLPVIVDPSHAAGKRELVADLSRAAIAAGADGLIIECHPEPDKSVSDARQALSLDDMVSLHESLSKIARAVGRSIPGPAHRSLNPSRMVDSPLLQAR